MVYLVEVAKLLRPLDGLVSVGRLLASHAWRLPRQEMFLLISFAASSLCAFAKGSVEWLGP